jgi:hypothetical protein
VHIWLGFQQVPEVRGPNHPDRGYLGEATLDVEFITGVGLRTLLFVRNVLWDVGRQLWGCWSSAVAMLVLSYGDAACQLWGCWSSAMKMLVVSCECAI